MTASNSTYDVIIMGAGINGCGIARELTQKGQNVLVLDKGVIGGGTSSKSSRLIHGGLRYLETLRLGMVYEALQDRQELLQLYPDLVQMRPFYLPITQMSPRPAWMIWMGLKLYDFLAGAGHQLKSTKVSKGAFLEEFSSLKKREIRLVLKYYDGKTDDWALTRQVAEDARVLGGEFIEGTEVVEVKWKNEGFEVYTDGSLYKCRILVNSTGPWIDETNLQLGLPARYQIRKISGIHLFVDGLLIPSPMFLQTRSKRIIFLIPEPELNQTLIGTTEREETGPIDCVEVQEEDIQYLLDAVNSYLKDSAKIQKEHVREVSLGVRALVSTRKYPTNLSREYQLDLHQRGNSKLLHVFGGKLTTYLSLGRRAVKMLGV